MVRENDARTYRLLGELDLSTIAMAEEILLAAAGEPGELRLDLSDLSFVDSTGLHLFLRLAQSSNDDLHLVNPPHVVRKLFSISGIGRVPNIVVVDEHGGE